MRLSRVLLFSSQKQKLPDAYSVAEPYLDMPHRDKVLYIYKNMLKESKDMPTPERRKWLDFKIKSEFRKYKNEEDKDEISLRVRLGEVQLDTIKVQVKHLNECFNLDPTPVLEKLMTKPITQDELFGDQDSKQQHTEDSDLNDDLNEQNDDLNIDIEHIEKNLKINNETVTTNGTTK
eukprot:TRINITY_DN299_c0_g1_i1.p1 TRINITY_DN299_c0_g1~~TRINITY_DN299_c0_g1_i1.p1  ORF type:complete len:177 (-),score=49.37 TRINITY_DN299_c0_g1_i1:83-613(-)